MIQLEKWGWLRRKSVSASALAVVLTLFFGFGLHTYLGDLVNRQVQSSMTNEVSLTLAMLKPELTSKLRAEMDTLVAETKAQIAQG